MLEEIQRDAIDGKVSVADTLRKLVALGGQVGSAELREWASSELRGYSDGPAAEVPNYRRVPAPLQLDGASATHLITGQSLSTWQLPEGIRDHIKEEVTITQSVGEIESMARQAERGDGALKLALPGGQDIVVLMNSESVDQFSRVERIYWSVSSVTLAGIVEQIRNRLVELVAELRAGTPSADLPSPEIADQAVHVVVYGKGNRINIASAPSTGDGTNEAQLTPSPDRMSLPKRVGACAVGVATIAGALFGLAQWQGWTL